MQKPPTLVETERTPHKRTVNLMQRETVRARIAQVLQKDGNPGHWFRLQFPDAQRKEVFVQHGLETPEHAEKILQTIANYVEEFHELLTLWEEVRVDVAMEGFPPGKLETHTHREPSGKPEVVLNPYTFQEHTAAHAQSLAGLATLQQKIVDSLTTKE